MSIETPGIVSIWIGRFESEAELEAYTDFVYDDEGDCACAFATDSGLGWFDHDFQEAVFYPEGVPGGPAALAGYSWSSSFSVQAAVALDAAHTPGVNALFLLYDCAYSPDANRPAQDCRLHFVGAFPYLKAVAAGE